MLQVNDIVRMLAYTQPKFLHGKVKEVRTDNEKKTHYYVVERLHDRIPLSLDDTEVELVATAKFKVADKVAVVYYDVPKLRNGTVTKIDIVTFAGNKPCHLYTVRREDDSVIEAFEDDLVSVTRQVSYANIDTVALDALRAQCYQAIATSPDLHQQTVENLVSDLIYRVLRAFRPDLFADFEKFGQYGTLAGLVAQLLPGEPWFAVPAHDSLCADVVSTYINKLFNAYDDLNEKVPQDRVHELQTLRTEVRQWQIDNDDKVKLPG